MPAENTPANNLRYPPGILLIRRISGIDWTLFGYRSLVLAVTFITYASYHASRKPSSIVKSYLNPGQKGGVTEFRPWTTGDIFVEKEAVMIYKSELKNNTGWAPFNGTGGTSLLGQIDLAFLGSYALGMFVAGQLGDRLDLRMFLTVGMVGSGFFVGLFGMGNFWDIHKFGFYLTMQIVAGLFQATGWPSVVTITGNWYRGKKMGFLMGVWNIHTSVGNIAGSFLAGCVLTYGWGWSFILPGALMVLNAGLVYLFLPAHPDQVGIKIPDETETTDVEASGVPSDTQTTAQDQDVEAQTPVSGVPSDAQTTAEGEDVISEEEALIGEHQQEVHPSPVTSGDGGSIGFGQAFLIPGVISYAFCLFFAKLVAYTFMYWLPYYLTQTAIGGKKFSVQEAGFYSSFFDVGGLIGGVLAGYISDKFNARAITAASFLYSAILATFLYHKYGSISIAINIVLMIIAGLLVNGPYALITTAVSADLGNVASVAGNSRSMATVTAIIDGTGSIGAAFGPLLTGFLSSIGWDAVFYMLMAGSFIAGLCLSGVVFGEIRGYFQAPTEQDSLTGPLLNGGAAPTE